MKGYEPTPSTGANKHPKRSFTHDYCSPGYYLITATALPGSPRLSEIPAIDFAKIKKGEMIIPIHTPLGKMIMDEIKAIPAHHPEMKILRFVVMPDHIHLVLCVQKRLERMLGSELAGFFGACSKANSRLQCLAETKTLFSTFHDRIILNRKQLDRAINMSRTIHADISTGSVIRICSDVTSILRLPGMNMRRSGIYSS